MKTGKIIRKIAMVISLVMLITSTVGTTYGYMVTSTDPITNVFVPNTVNVSGLTISKAVEHPLGEYYQIPNNIAFDFEVELGAYYANAKLTTTIGEMTADENGVLRISVKPGVNFDIEGLEEGTEVKVTELATQLPGFAVKGDAVQTVTVGAEGTASIRFVNTYTPAAVKPDNVSVGGEKILEGRDWQDGDSFTFVLEQKVGENWTELGKKTITYDPENANFNRFDFSDIFGALNFDEVGTYSFRMSEVVGDLENVDYDKTVNRFTVLVTDVNMDGALEISAVSGSDNTTVTSENGAHTVSVVFNNTFVPPVVPDPDPITVLIGIDKIVHNVGDEDHGLAGFEFVLKKTGTSQGVPVVSNDIGKASFTLAFTKDDIGQTYAYKLTETNQGLVGMFYDSHAYQITVSISLDENNELVAALTMDGEKVDALNATFENTYDPDTPVSPPTGDMIDPIFWLVMMVISGSMFIALVVYDRKRSRA